MRCRLCRYMSGGLMRCRLRRFMWGINFFFFFFFFHEQLFIYFSSLRYSIYITILTLLTIRVTYTENTITQLNLIQAI